MLQLPGDPGFIFTNRCLHESQPVLLMAFFALVHMDFLWYKQKSDVQFASNSTLCSSWQQNKNVQSTFIEWIVIAKSAASINVQTHPLLGSPRLNCLRLCKQGDPVEFMATCLKNREALSHIRSGWKLEEKRSHRFQTVGPVGC